MGRCYPYHPFGTRDRVKVRKDKVSTFPRLWFERTGSILSYPIQSMAYVPMVLLIWVKGDWKGKWE